MSLQTLQIITLFTGVALLFAQLLVSNKQTSHVLFAIFCGSITLMVIKQLSGNTIGAYQYLIGMGTCATCNGYWLLSRSLFRDKNAIAPQHLILAGAIAMLVLINQGYWFAQSANLMGAVQNDIARYFLEELTVLLSSCILVLTFWEACRNFTKAQQHDKAQRLFFLATFGGAVVAAKVSERLFITDPTALKMAITVIILTILTSTQILILWRLKTRPVAQEIPDNAADNAVQKAAEVEIEAEPQTMPIEPANQSTKPVDEPLLAEQIKALLIDSSLFLQANLKVADIARQLDVPEYRVSNALRHNLNARNFNHYINELRIKHAQTLLADSDKQKWSVLVVALESGFASVGPFTRAFKTATGFTPSQYRKSLENPCPEIVMPG